MKSISIGPLQFDRATFMAPMEGITDVPFRRIVKKYGCGVTCTQMIHAEALLLSDERRVAETSAIVESEKPVGLQLCSPDPSLLSEAAKKAEQLGAGFIDVNMGCPAKNVVARGAGAAILQTPALAGDIVRALVLAVKIPITVKIRAGWDEHYRTGLEVARIVEREGAACVAVHARTRAQKFKGSADWDLIGELKSHLTIPVIGNGDVFAFSDIDRMFETTKADGAMVARGALGNPWIFNGHQPNVGEVYKTLLEHLDYHLSFYGQHERALVTFRKHIVWYTKGIANAAEFRVRLFKEKAHDKVMEMMNSFFGRLDPSSYPGS